MRLSEGRRKLEPPANQALSLREVELSGSLEKEAKTTQMKSGSRMTPAVALAGRTRGKVWPMALRGRRATGWHRS
jgi:predicted Ser/Thr protein kinase